MILSLLTPLCESHTYYVTPTTRFHPGCKQSKPCYTLAYYLQNAESLINGKPNVSLQFLNGNHTLHTTDASAQFFELVNIHELVFSGSEETSNTNCVIEAPFISIGNVSSLILQDCHLVKSLLEIVKVDSLRMSRFSFTSSSLFISATGNSQLLGTWCYSCRIILSQVGSLAFSDGYFENTDISYFANLDNNDFSLTHFNSSDSVMSQSSLLVYLGIGNHHVILNNSSFFGQGSGITAFIQLLTGNARNHSSAVLHVVQCSFSDDSTGVQVISGGTTDMSLLDCLFKRNRIGFSATVLKGNFNAVVQNTIFDMLNYKQRLQTYFYAFKKVRKSHILLRNVSYLHNNVDLFLGTLVLSGPLNLTVENCAFRQNFGLISTIFLRSVNILFRGSNSFYSNLGSTGGALYMSHSTLWLDKDAHIRFENNSVSNLGGAIFFEEDRNEIFLDVLFRAESKRKCFYQLTSSVGTVSDLPMLSFINNSAEMGGDNIYGTSIASDCEVTPNGTTTSNQIKDEVFRFHSTSISSISSSSRRVCLCENNVPQCDSVDYIFRNTTATSGEKFSVSLALVGNDFGTVTGVVYASNFDDLSADQSLGARQKHQQILTNKECSSIEYSIHSKSHKVTIYLSKDSIAATSQRAIRSSLPFCKEALASAIRTYEVQGIIEFILLYVPVSITVNIIPCPLGFELRTTDLVCQCEQFFSEYVRNCSVENLTGLMNRNGTVWLGAISMPGNTTNAVLAHKLCPFGYCRSNCVRISLDQPDEQCDFNRSGILCGGCPSGFSLALGSSRCLQCPDERYLSLLVTFMLAGVVLVVLIKILDLTVARGTVNGLILYANIMWINQGIFFPSESDDSDHNIINFYQIIKVFVAWLNLDLGIETCFFSGLDAYWKTWLQFAFPFYLWSLAILIVVACHYSPKVTKVCGNNTVTVLATIIMLSYVKLLRTVVTILSFANLQQYNPPGVQYVWLEDGNISYLGSRHRLLFIAALLVLFLLWLPFTVVLLLIPYLKRSSNSNITNWTNKFKPLFDSYLGPLNDGHHCWIGLTLFVRVILAILAVAVQAMDPIINIDLSVIIALLLIILLHNAYRKTHNFVLELLFLTNIAVTGVAYLSTTDVYSRIVFTCVSGLTTFILFLIIVIFHTYKSLKSAHSICCKHGSDGNNGSNACIVASNLMTVSQDVNETNTKDDPSSFVTRTTIELSECILET